MKILAKAIACLLAFIMLAAAVSCAQSGTGDSGTNKDPDTSGAVDSGTQTDPDTQTDQTIPLFEPVSSHMDFDTFHIGVYTMGPHTTENVDDMKAAGVDFIIDGSFSTELLDYIQSKGMGVFLKGAVPSWWGDSGQRAGQMKDSAAHALDIYRSKAAAVADHPAIWMIDVGDEPSALDLEYYGKVCDAVLEGSEEKYYAYLNLYPGYASAAAFNADAPSQLGVQSFRKYIEIFARDVQVPYICFDHYCYGKNTYSPPQIAQYYLDLRDVGDICREYGRHFWIVLQVNTNSSNASKNMKEFNLRFQAYTAMAFGADQITWACWAPGWFYNNVLDESGQKTQQYEILKTVNEELHAVGAELVKYRNTNTSLVGFKEGSKAYLQVEKTSTPGRNGPVEMIVDKVSTARFTDVCCPEEYSMIVGTMVARDGSGKEALMIADATDAFGSHEAYDISFGFEGEGTVTAYCGKEKTQLSKGADGKYHFSMEYCQGVLITVE
ncbi:MAG: hypothetical protein IJR83_05555 [Clostridia bacterium]|nr:hypothetical protein [Clostridia bacterium]